MIIIFTIFICAVAIVIALLMIVKVLDRIYNQLVDIGFRLRNLDIYNRDKFAKEVVKEQEKTGK